ncbi:MAG: hypothetical protein CO119_07255 [Flavobacteriales bacterium CG_4_9_14_3_um_filter_40_17]|nr:MAG: hypothetical protein CO119_07255 [Flavobacteriales bacterium CG_4_9_14_3_um_filter_40_17]
MPAKLKFELEFTIRASPSMLFQYISTPSGLSEWFAENVNSRGEIFSFLWDGFEEKAKLISKKNDEKVRFRWLEDEDSNSYFEMKIVEDDITKDVSLVITDFSEEEETENAKLLWESQISDLRHILGAS